MRRGNRGIQVKTIFRKLAGNDLVESFVILIVFILLLLTSCAGSQDRSQALLAQHGGTSAQVAEDVTKSEKLNAGLVQKNSEFRKAFSTSDYRIGPEDLLEIDVFQVPDLKTTARVSARGFIKLSLIDGIEANGLTVAELEALIAKRLEKFVKEPVVSVFVREYRSQQISVLGAVRDPRVYYATGQKYLLDMLSLAGGLAQDAGSVCIIQRALSNSNSDAENPEKLVVDLDELLVNGRAEFNVPVHSGDVIHVPKAGIFFVDGAVRSPGDFHLKEKITVTQAISMAKGMGPDALQSGVKIYRDTGLPQREVIDIDYSAVLDGKAPDPLIKDKDIILVDSSAFKRFLSGLTGALNFGMFSLGGRGF